jgi:lysophospholipase L1-like esterase
MHMIQRKPSSRQIRVAALLLGVACASCSSSTERATPGASAGAFTGGTSGGVSTGGNTAVGSGTGGSTTGGSGSGAALQQACAAACGTEKATACYKDTCQADCVALADATLGFGMTCKAQFTAMTQCASALTGDKWTCSSDENVPIPVEGQCTSTVCDWACCATDLLVPSDIWARCMATCPQGTSGTGGDSVIGGTAGNSGNVGSGGSTGSKGGSTGTGGSANGGAGVAGPPPSNGAIPAGYPAPTADNAAKCTTVPMAAGFCPGGGSGPVCLQCLFGGTTYSMTESPPAPADAIAAAGDYVVTVQLGAVGPVSVSAESSRGLLAQGTASQEYAFVVDVRAMEGQPNHAGGPAGYAGLDLYFSGPAGLKVSGIGYALASPATKPVMVYIAGDSTVCDQTGNVFGGWGQMLPQYFAPPVGFANYANSGAASGSFGSYWSMIKAKWTAGDWVMIQFGHNDKNDSDAQVQANLEKMVADAQAANVTPILVSPPARVGSIPISDQSSLHAAAAKAAAASKGCAYIDLTALSTAWYDTLPDVKTALSFHANAGATHTNLAGADKLAQLLANAIKTQNIGLAKYLR